MKQCKCCQVTKPLSEFYKHSKAKDGHESKCKECKKLLARVRHQEKKQDPEWVEKERARGREKYRRLGYKHKYKTDYNTTVAYRVNYPHKYKAQTAAQRVGCPKGLVRHHWSYNPEHYQDVIILEPEDHYLVHRHITYDEDTLMYFTSEGKLLRCRTSHVLYIKRIIEENGTTDRTYEIGNVPIASILPKSECDSRWIRH